MAVIIPTYLTTLIGNKNHQTPMKMVKIPRIFDIHFGMKDILLRKKTSGPLTKTSKKINPASSAKLAI